MGFLQHWHAPRAASEGTSKRPAVWDDFWYTNGLGFLSTSGQRVSGDRALTIPPFWRAVRILSENIASFKCRVYERKDRGHAIAKDHPYAITLGMAGNPDLTAFELWECLVVHVVIRGRAFALKRFVPDPASRRERLELWPLHPDRVKVSRTPSLQLTYEVRDENGGKPKTFGTDEVFHLRGMGLDGIDGANMVAYATNSLGGMLAAEGFAQRFFKSGVSAAVQAVVPEQLGDEGVRNLRASIMAYIAGLENAYGVFVGEDKVELKPIGVEPEKAQLLETRQLSAKQVAQWLNLPPGMLGETETPTFASSKQFRQDLVDLTFRPLAERIEARIDLDLLAPRNADTPMRYFSKFELNALLRGSTDERYKAHETAIRSGFKTRNECRLDEDMEPLDGLDEPIFALNMGTTSGDTDAAPPRGSSGRSDRAAQIVLQEATHLVRKELAAVRKLATRHASDGGAWQAGLREFYGKHAEEVAQRLCMPLEAAQEYVGRQGLRLSERGIAACEDWERTLPRELAAAALEPDAIAGRLNASPTVS